MFGGWGAPVADGFSLLVAAGATFLCCVFALWSSLRRLGAARKKTAIESVWWNNRARRRSCSCGASSSSMSNHFNGDMAAGEAILSAASEEKRLIGASMMEQLVPEITTHALSYLDYPSLCRLSMTNSSMRRAANDDNAWKALYHKDFTVEQDGITPVNGWKAYYAATKAVVDVNAEFFDIIRTRSLSSMSRLWLPSDYVKCIHSSGELFTGYTAVMDSWAVLLNWVQDGGGQRWAGFEIRDVRARVIGDAAWVNMKAYVDVDSDPFHVTNIFELHHGRWFIVHHHSSIMLAGHNNILG